MPQTGYFATRGSRKSFIKIFEKVLPAGNNFLNPEIENTVSFRITKQFHQQAIIYNTASLIFSMIFTLMQPGNGNYTLKAAGLLEASLGGLQLTSGRFDHKYTTSTPPF